MTKNEDDRIRGLNLRDIPGLAAMLAVSRWCLWYWRVIERKDGRRGRTKVPVIPGTGIGVRVNDLEGVVGYDAASAAVLAEGAAGVGWRMEGDLGLVALDLDHCRDPRTGKIDAWALAILTAAPGAYREVTPSGTGLRVIGRLGGGLKAFQGKLRVEAWIKSLEGSSDAAEERAFWGGGIKAGAAIELFHACARFITMTGWDGIGSCEADITEVTEWLLERARDQGGDRAPKGMEGRNPPPAALLRGPIEDVNACLDIILNPDAIDWERWSNMGMGIWGATGGSEEGLTAWLAWSAKAEMTHDETTSLARWDHWSTISPPKWSGAWTLVRRAREIMGETGKGWLPPSRRPEAEFEAVEGPEGNGGIPPWAPFGGEGVARRRIKIIAGELHHLASEGEAAIIASGLPVFQRAMLVRPAIMEMDAADGDKTQVTGLHRLDAPGMLDLFCQTGEWMKYSRTLKKDVKADPPEVVANILLKREGEWNFPYLRGIIAHPTIRRDGTLIDRNGYDKASGYYLALPPGLNVPSISDKPSKGECVAAMEELEGLLIEFPFVRDDEGASRSVALSLLMTAVVRAAMDVAPIHAATAPRRGSGKSFLYDIAAAIVYGSRCPVIYAGNSSEELEKKLNGLLLAGVTLFSIDNLNMPLEGDLICQIATQPLLDLRRLGRSDMYRTPNSALAGVTGNNMVVMEDVTRRVVMASMDAKMERPELRQFKANPFRTVMRNRGRYIAAVLTIVRGYLTAGEKSAPEALASFDDYTRFVRAPLVWLGQPDPAGTMTKLHEADPVMAGLRGVMAAWEAAIGLDIEKTAAEVVETVDSRAHTFTEGPPGESKDEKEEREANEIAAARKARHGLGVALAAISRRGTGITAPELGQWLRRHKDEIADKRQFKGEMDSHSKVMGWKLIKG
jgi:putative DNA primase/helicase